MLEEGKEKSVNFDVTFLNKIKIFLFEFKADSRENSSVKSMAKIIYSLHFEILGLIVH